MNFSELVERLKIDPRVILESVKKYSPWRQWLFEDGMTEMAADEFLLWNKENPSYYKSFEAKTLDAISRGEKVTAVAMMDRIGCDHNRGPGLTRVFKRKYPEHSWYYKTKKLKGEQ